MVQLKCCQHYNLGELELQLLFFESRDSWPSSNGFCDQSNQADKGDWDCLGCAFCLLASLNTVITATIEFERVQQFFY